MLWTAPTIRPSGTTQSTGRFMSKKTCRWAGKWFRLRPGRCLSSCCNNLYLFVRPFRSVATRVRSRMESHLFLFATPNSLVVMRMICWCCLFCERDSCLARIQGAPKAAQFQSNLFFNSHFFGLFLLVLPTCSVPSDSFVRCVFVSISWGFRLSVCYRESGLIQNCNLGMTWGDVCDFNHGCTR